MKTTIWVHFDTSDWSPDEVRWHSGFGHNGLRIECEDKDELFERLEDLAALGLEFEVIYFDNQEE